MSILNSLYDEAVWREFLRYKIEKQHLSLREQKKIEEYISSKAYIPILQDIGKMHFQFPIPYKKELNKGGTTKKRIVYSYPEAFNMFLKMIAFSLYHYDEIFSGNCYAFRRNYGVKDAIKRIRNIKRLSEKYCLKVDISNYFNSIDVSMLLEKLCFLKKEDEDLYQLFECLLTANQAVVTAQKPKNRSEGMTQADKNPEYVNLPQTKSNQEYGKLRQSEEVNIIEHIITDENRGAMAGTPISPFFANVYLMEVDRYFARQNILYFRYSDDILICTDSMEQLKEYQAILYQWIESHHLTLNMSKVRMSNPGEPWEFLGFCYRDGEVDLSDNTKQKIKGKIKRKAHALRRWQEKKDLSGEKAAKGFIKAMNHKFFDSGDGTEFSWSRWFFPNLTTDAGLKEIDAYMQQYIRYCVTGRHNKGNYQVTYEQMKAWGYRNLVYEYYKGIDQCKK